MSSAIVPKPFRPMKHLDINPMRFIAFSLLFIIGVGALLSCSTTRHLPEGEQLYIGVKEIVEEAVDEVSPEVHTEVNATLNVLPNSSLLGSARYRWPFPLGLWSYNAFYTERKSGFRHWLFSALKSDPILVSQVNPALRASAAEIAMTDNGYFGGKVDYEILPQQRDPREAQVRYTVHYPQPYRISSVTYMPTESQEVNDLLREASPGSLLRVGNHFSALHLEKERERLTKLLHNNGFLLYSQSNIQFLADSTSGNHQVALRVYLAQNLSSPNVLHRCVIDSVRFTLDNGMGRPANQRDTTQGFISVDYRGRLRMRPRVLASTVPIGEGELYGDWITARIKSGVSRLNTFKYNSVQYVLLPPDSVSVADSLNRLRLDLTATYDYPWVGQMEVNAVGKDNHQVGPRMTFKAQRRNCFRGGELFSLEASAGYEWVTGHRASYTANNGLLNSYEFGLKGGLHFPRLLLPSRLFQVDREYPVSTSLSLSSNIMRRSGFFQMFNASAEVKYDFYTNDVSAHSISPLRLTYTSLMATSARFDSIVGSNKVLSQSFSNRFIPAIEYSYTYDNRTLTGHRPTRQWLQVSLTESAGLLNAIMAKVSEREKGDRRLLWQRYSQFVKATADFRNYISFSPRVTLATRLIGGIAWAYGNSSVVPYSEQFFIGGANSLRGFGIRSLGPGAYKVGRDRFAYMDQTGDVKMEANVELRFPILGDFHGAVFADAGNVWTLRSEATRPGGQFTSHFMRELATDCGLGLRYDFGMLVVRFDVGVPLHDPTVSDQGSYYNISGSFFGNLGYHLAVGYPF